ncbi:MAG: type III pantothenate kinase [Gemmatimonadaceae bacterium]
MIIGFDAGNSETTIGLFDGETIAAHWRISSAERRTSDELGVLLHSLMLGSNVAGASVDGAVVASVVPAVTPVIGDSLERYFAVKPMVIDSRSPLPIRLEVDEPETVGADRIINTVAASRLYRRDTIVVDLGTATTYDCVTADGAFLGGVIQPGIRSSAETLFRRTAKLPATELSTPVSVIGKRTEECIRAGVLYGAADSIDGLVRRLRAAWPGGGVPYVVATGGLAGWIRPFCRELDAVEPELTLHGLRIAYDLCGGEGPGRPGASPP